MDDYQAGYLAGVADHGEHHQCGRCYAAGQAAAEARVAALTAERDQLMRGQGVEWETLIRADKAEARVAALTAALVEIGRTSESVTYPAEKARSVVEMWREDLSRYDVADRDEVLIRAITVALRRYGAERYAQAALDAGKAG